MKYRWVAFYALSLIVVMPVLFAVSIGATRNAVVVAQEEFANRDVSRALWQTRYSFGKAALSCPRGRENVPPEALEACLTHLEAAASQFDSGLKVIDPTESLRKQLFLLADLVESLLAEAQANALSPPSTPESFLEAWSATDALLERLGILEGTHWRAAAAKHAELRQQLNTLSSQQLALLLLFTGINFAFLALLVRVTSANARVLSAQREIASQRALLAHSSKLSALGEMAGGIAHEINNPLAVINGRVQILRTLAREGDIEKRLLEEGCEKIERNVDRITNIIRSLRNMARDLPGDPLQPAHVEALVRDALDLCRERFRLKGIDLHVQTDAKGLHVLCRPNEVGQILLNALNNAFDAVSELSAGDRWVKILVSPHLDRVRFHITDAGKGIPETLRTRIFEPFFTTKGLSKGTGLGMSIARSLAEGQGGQFFLNEESPHTQFILELPLAKGGEA